MNIVVECNRVVNLFKKKELEDVGGCKEYKKGYYLPDITHVEREEVKKGTSSPNMFVQMFFCRSANSPHVEDVAVSSYTDSTS